MAPSRGSRPTAAPRAPKATKVVKPRTRRTAPTPSHKNHTYRTFTSLISTLTIAPLRSASSRPDLAPLSLDLTSSASSHFASQLREWADLNLSSHFSSFVDDVAPLAESLPMVLHHETAIVDKLLEAIAGAGKESLEPLMSLVGHLAHDLDFRFEGYFERTWDVIASRVAKEESVEGIEAGFKALAYVVKYMSRVLLGEGEVAKRWWTDVGKWLGKERQRPFVVRFMGEVVGFLLRRAGKKEGALESILGTLFGDFLETGEQLHAEGLKVALSEAARGVKGGVHPDGVRALEASWAFARNAQGETADAALSIIKGALIGIIHQSDSKGFQAVVDGLIRSWHEGDRTQIRHVVLSMEIFFTVITTRKGTRINDWRMVTQASFEILKQASELQQDRSTQAPTEDEKTLPDRANALLAALLQSTPVLELSKSSAKMNEVFLAMSDVDFLSLCMLLADLDSQRFRSFVLPAFQSRISTREPDLQDALTIAMVRLHELRALQPKDMTLPVKWQRPSELFSGSNYDGMALYRVLKLLQRSHGSDGAFKNSITDHVWRSLGALDEDRLQKNESSAQSRQHRLLFGEGLLYAAVIQPPNFDQFQVVLSGAAQFGDMPVYWRALKACLKGITSDITLTASLDFESLAGQICLCLRSHSHELRLSALQCLQILLEIRPATNDEICTILLSIEESPVNVELARFISSKIRQLGLKYESISTDPVLSKIVPNYCFGLLHLKLSQAWSDASEVLRTISSFPIAESVIIEILEAWLGGGQVVDSSSSALDWSPFAPDQATTGFQCTNVNATEAALENARFAVQDPEDKVFALYDRDHAIVSQSDLFNRTQALKVMNAIPQLTEKRSRLLIPVLLKWVDQESEDDTDGGRWSRKDQKAMLDVFAQFQNPRVLFRSAEMYQALLKLLTNGDVEIQKSALKAILTWKQSAVVRYEQHLQNLLDDARFREELSVFMRPDEEDGVRAEDLSELAPVLLRLLYGLLVSRTSNASGARGKQVKRKAVFSALARFPSDILDQFISIALEPVESRTNASTESNLLDRLSALELHPRKRIGVLNTIDDLLDTLAGDLQPAAVRLTNVSLACLIKTWSFEDSQEAGDKKPEHAALFKTVRSTALRCLSQIYTHLWDPSLSAHAEIIITSLLCPRLDNFVPEFAQAISGVLRVLSAWASHSDTCQTFLLKPSGLLPAVIRAVEASICPVTVKQFIVDEIISRVLSHATGDSEEMQISDVHDITSSSEIRGLLQGHASAMLHALTSMIQGAPPKQLLDSSLSCIESLAAFVESEDGAQSFISVATVCLRETGKKIPLQSKLRLLRAARGLLPTANLDAQSLDEKSIKSDLFRTTCIFFAMMKGRDERQLLCDVLAEICAKDADLAVIVNLCADLNSFAAGRVEEPDYSRRSAAYTRISEELSNTLTTVQWRPLLYNLLYFIQDEDLSIRAGASHALQQFIRTGGADDSEHTKTQAALVTQVLLPGLKDGMRNSSELVRTEHLAILELLVRQTSPLPEVSDMVPLLAGNDEEASFFSNVLHVQQHRRLRALRRLAAEGDKCQISSSNVATVFFPLLEHFVFDAEQSEGAHNLTAEAITTLGSLAKCLQWSQYKALLRRYISHMKDMEGKEKTIFRLIGSMIDTLSRASTSIVDTADVASAPPARLRDALPPRDSLTTTISESFLPPLMNFLHGKDDSTVSLRVPVAVSAVKLLKCLSEEALVSKLPAVLMDLCFILRSRDQGSRDMTRKTLAEISALLGPSYFHFIIKSLRSALQRGYQLHVLSYTIHSILVGNLPGLSPGDLDHCLSDLASIVMDDIFGVTGQEKDTEEYISRMKEVKSSKSFDSMELAAKITTLPHLRTLMMPIRALLREKLDLRTVKKVDELLRRLGQGISHNQGVIGRDVLVFCFEIIQMESLVRQENAKPGRVFNDYKTKRYLIQMEAAHKSTKRGSTTSYVFKLTRFAMDMLRSILHKHQELSTPENLSGFVPVISEAMLSGQEEVQLSAMRLLTSIMRIPLPTLESNSSIYVAEAVKLVKAAPSMTSESAQAALKLISTALRDRTSSKIREADLAHVLTRIKPDLEEPDRQGVIFNFLKVVLGRQIVITEVYEIMDAVAAIMVTNQTRQARDLSRGIYFQFLMDYPQAKDRLGKQIGFLVKNMEYPYPEGRQSVLELLHLTLQKSGESVGQTIAASVLVPLVMMLANDEDGPCREMASVLTKQILKDANEDNKKTYLAMLRQWLQQDEQVLLRRVSLQIWKMQVEIGGTALKDVDFLMDALGGDVLARIGKIPVEEWEMVYYGLQLFAQISQNCPEKAFAAQSKQIWAACYHLLGFPHAWVKLAASKLVGLLFGEIGKTHKEIGLGMSPLRSSGSIQLSEPELQQLRSQSLRVLRYDGSSQQLLAQTCRNIVFLGRCFGANGMLWKHSDGANGLKDDETSSNNDDEYDGVGDTNEEETESNGEAKTALQFLLFGLCGTLRRNQSATSPGSVPPKIASLQILHALVNMLDPELYIALLPAILHPLLLLTDPSIAKPTSTNPTFTQQYTDLVQQAQETMTLLQSKVGSAVYVRELGQAQGRLREKREERRVKRRIDVVARPEEAEKRKQRRFEGKVRRKKERATEFKGRRRGW